MLEISTKSCRDEFACCPVQDGADAELEGFLGFRTGVDVNEVVTQESIDADAFFAELDLLLQRDRLDNPESPGVDKAKVGCDVQAVVAALDADIIGADLIATGCDVVVHFRETTSDEVVGGHVVSAEDADLEVGSL